jgi:Fe/S biogenesis protein NfuA
MNDVTSTDGRVLAVTDAALADLLAVRQEEPDAGALGLCVSIDSPAHHAFSYDLVFERVATAPLSHHIERHGELRVMIPGGDVEKLRGATLDHDGTMLVIRNPNRPGPPPLDGFLGDGERADEVRTVLNETVNPQLALHGGSVELVGVRDDVVALSFAGGCQGCALSRTTMSDGIEATLQEHLSWFGGVFDVTDHAAGQNPYLR